MEFTDWTSLDTRTQAGTPVYHGDVGDYNYIRTMKIFFFPALHFEADVVNNRASPVSVTFCLFVQISDILELEIVNSNPAFNI